MKKYLSVLITVIVFATSIHAQSPVDDPGIAGPGTPGPGPSGDGATATISSFTPTTASSGTVVTIIGSGFTGASAVSFGGTVATSFTVVNDNTITAVVGGGTSGTVSISSPGGTVSLGGFVYTTTNANGQAPQLMSFQSVVRDNAGKLVANHSVGLRLSILQGSITGNAVYVETQTANSNANGLVTLQVGGGTVTSGTFSAIDWSAGPYYIKSEIDPTGGTSYLVAGTTQLLSVAYALYANKAGSTTSSATGSGGGTHLQTFTPGAYKWVVPNNISSVLVEMWSAGGGGGVGGYTMCGGSGGNGAYGKGSVSVNPGDTITINVGAGGQGCSMMNNGCIGQDGGNTSFGNTLLATGGKAGTGYRSVGGVNGAAGACNAILNCTSDKNQFLGNQYGFGGSGRCDTGPGADVTSSAGTDGFLILVW